MTTTETTIGINGMAHVMLTVSQFAVARAFYGRLLPALGMTPVCDTDKLFYCVGPRTAIGIQPPVQGFFVFFNPRLHQNR